MDEAVRRAGDPGIPRRPAVHEYAIRAIRAGADSASDLARRLAITKQAAAKTIAALDERGYVTTETDPADIRRMRLYVTSHGLAMLREGEEIFNQLRGQWEKQVGADALAQVESTLRHLVGDSGGRPDTPAWLARGLEA